MADTTTREELQELRDSFADLFRQHTRAIWALKGEVEYPLEERKATAQRATAALGRFDELIERLP